MKLKSLWKVSVYDEKLKGYVIKRVGLSCKSAAENCAKLFERDGYITRISPILPDAVEEEDTGNDESMEIEKMAKDDKKQPIDDVKKTLTEINVYNSVISDIMDAGTKEANKIAKSLLQKNIDRVNAIIEK